MRVLAALAALLLLAACSSSTSGHARTSSPPPVGPTTPDFTPPSTPAGSTTPETTSAAPSDTGIPPPSKPLRTATAHAPDGTSYLVSIWAEHTDKTCADHAHGKPVVDYLTAHKCSGLHRLLATTTVDARAVGLAIADLGFVGKDPQVYSTAGKFDALVEKDGTGNIDDLLREGYRLPAGPTSVPSPDAFSALSQDAGVEVVDGWYLTGSTPDNDPKLVAMEQDLFLQLGD